MLSDYWLHRRSARQSIDLAISDIDQPLFMRRTVSKFFAQRT